VGWLRQNGHDYWSEHQAADQRGESLHHHSGERP
jgi:hypothetical protein